MAHKNIYVRDEDIEIFARAEAISGTSLSAIVSAALREFLERHEPHNKPVEKHIIEIGIWGAGDKPNDDDNTKRVAFRGTLIGTHRESLDRAKNGTRRRVWRAYITEKGTPLVYCKYETQWQGERDMADYMTMDKDDLKDSFVPENIENFWSPSNMDTTPMYATIPLPIMTAIRKAVTLTEVEELNV